MEYRIEMLLEKKLIGMRLPMSFANNGTANLWRGFMPRRGEVANAIGRNLYSLQQYPLGFSFNPFDFQKIFDKWAAVEVRDFGTVPQGMNSFVLQGGLYAVFHYKGLPSDGELFFRHIFGEWLPNSGYRVDNSRPHFEILGEKYSNTNPESEEEIWIPIQQ